MEQAEKTVGRRGFIAGVMAAVASAALIPILPKRGEAAVIEGAKAERVPEPAAFKKRWFVGADFGRTSDAAILFDAGGGTLTTEMLEQAQAHMLRNYESALMRSIICVPARSYGKTVRMLNAINLRDADLAVLYGIGGRSAESVAPSSTKPAFEVGPFICPADREVRKIKYMGRAREVRAQRTMIARWLMQNHNA